RLHLRGGDRAGRFLGSNFFHARELSKGRAALSNPHPRPLSRPLPPSLTGRGEKNATESDRRKNHNPIPPLPVREGGRGRERGPGGEGSGGGAFRLLLLLLLFAIPATPRQAPDRSAQRFPNVVILTIDTLRADHVAAYGYHRPTTPNIDRLL